MITNINCLLPITQESDRIVLSMLDADTGVNIKSRRYHFTTYDNCFVGTECVDWFVHDGLAASRSEAVALGNTLLAAGRIHHVTGEHPFEDDSLFFRITESNANGAVPPSPIQRGGRNNSVLATRIEHTLEQARARACSSSKGKHADKFHRRKALSFYFFVEAVYLVGTLALLLSSVVLLSPIYFDADALIHRPAPRDENLTRTSWSNWTAGHRTDLLEARDENLTSTAAPGPEPEPEAEAENQAASLAEPEPLPEPGPESTALVYLPHTSACYLKAQALGDGVDWYVCPRYDRVH